MGCATSADKQSTNSSTQRQHTDDCGSCMLQRKPESHDGQALAHLISTGSSGHSILPSSLNNSSSQSGYLSSIVQNAVIQKRLTVGKPNDRFEQEADMTADRVVGAGPAVQASPG